MSAFDKALIPSVRNDAGNSFEVVVRDGRTLILLDGNTVAAARVTESGVVFDAGGVDYAALPLDAQGNAIANVNHRTGTLAYLLSIVGGEGEIALATDVQAIVRYGVAGVPYIYGAGAEVDFYQAYSSTGNAVASGAVTDLTLDAISNGPVGNFTLASGLILPTNRAINGRQKMVCEAACVVEIESPVATLGTYRNVILWETGVVNAPIGRMTIAPAPLGQPTRVAFTAKAVTFLSGAIVPSFKVRVIQDSGESLNCTLLDLTVTSKLRNI